MTPEQKIERLRHDNKRLREALETFVRPDVRVFGNCRQDINHIGEELCDAVDNAHAILAETAEDFGIV